MAVCDLLRQPWQQLYSSDNFATDGGGRRQPSAASSRYSVEAKAKAAACVRPSVCLSSLASERFSLFKTTDLTLHQTVRSRKAWNASAAEWQTTTADSFKAPNECGHCKYRRSGAV